MKYVICNRLHIVDMHICLYIRLQLLATRLLPGTQLAFLWDTAKLFVGLAHPLIVPFSFSRWQTQWVKSLYMAISMGKIMLD